MLGRHRVFYFALGLIAIAAIATQTVAYYYFQDARYSSPTRTATSCHGTSTLCITVNTLINYGNKTLAWHNVSDIPANWNFYQLTDRIAKVTATYYGPPLNEHLVTGIDGIQESGAYSWRLWTFCKARTAWVFSSIGADSIRLNNNESLAWSYQGDPNQSPISGALTVGSCS